MLRRRHDRGFTLIEIMLVLGVLGLLGAIFAVNMGGVTRQERLRAAARKLAGTSDFIRSQAAGSKQTAYLEIDFDRNCYRFWQEPPQDVFGRFVDPDDGHMLTEDEIKEWKEVFQWEDLPRDVFFRRLWFNPRQFYEKGTINVEYRPDGRLDTYILWLQAAADDPKDGAWFSIVVNGLSGKSEVHDYPARFPEAVEADFRDAMGADLPGAR